VIADWAQVVNEANEQQLCPGEREEVRERQKGGAREEEAEKNTTPTQGQFQKAQLGL